MTKHVMIDIETMGNGPEAAIIAIGAAKFDPYDNHKVDDTFYTPVTLESSLIQGLKVDASTIMWWLHEDRADARRALLVQDGIDLFSALDGFTQWYGSDSLPTWGNGATFDLVIMRNAMRKTGFDCCWKFWDERCFRTLKNLHQVPSVLPPVGVAHHALYDAILQSYQLQAVYQNIAKRP